MRSSYSLKSYEIEILCFGLSFALPATRKLLDCFFVISIFKKALTTAVTTRARRSVFPAAPTTCPVRWISTALRPNFLVHRAPCDLQTPLTLFASAAVASLVHSRRSFAVSPLRSRRSSFACSASDLLVVSASCVHRQDSFEPFLHIRFLLLLELFLRNFGTLHSPPFTIYN